MGKSFKRNIDETLEMMGLKDTGDKKVADFSLGMKQRLALARVFLTKPVLLVLDEPINGLDPLGISDVQEILLKINKTYNTAILISSHIISETDKIADTIGIIDHGVMLEECSVDEIRKKNCDLEDYFKGVIRRGQHA